MVVTQWRGALQDDNKRNEARIKLEAANEQRRFESDRRLQSAGERAEQEIRRREEVARTSNQAAEEVVFLGARGKASPFHVPTHLSRNMS
eukprot:gene836-4855_t